MPRTTTFQKPSRRAIRAAAKRVLEATRAAAIHSGPPWPSWLRSLLVDVQFLSESVLNQDLAERPRSC